MTGGGRGKLKSESGKLKWLNGNPAEKREWGAGYVRVIGYSLVVVGGEESEWTLCVPEAGQLLGPIAEYFF